jgi:RNA polymerase sigma factor (TIGR02999 family)
MPESRAPPVAREPIPVLQFRAQQGSRGFPRRVAGIIGCQYALRESEEKTVMTGKSTRSTAKKESAEPGTAAKGRKSLDHLFSAAYEELRRLASTVRRGDPSATLNPTALVNEAWIKLAKSPEIAATSRLHFKRIAARAMRQLLVEAARRRKAGKRGAGAEITVTFDAAEQKAPSDREDLLALDRALDELAQMNERQAIMVESRFFGGLDIPETAELLNVSEATVLRDWRAAKAWLAHELHQA